jgi:hypothetical protein
MTRVKPGDNARTRKVTCLKTILSRNLPTLNSSDDSGGFWALIGSKNFETSYFPGFGIITRVDQGRETSVPTH